MLLIVLLQTLKSLNAISDGPWISHDFQVETSKFRLFNYYQVLETGISGPQKITEIWILTKETVGIKSIEHWGWMNKHGNTWLKILTWMDPE